MSALLGASVAVVFCFLSYWFVVRPDDIAMKEQQERSRRADREFEDILNKLEVDK